MHFTYILLLSNSKYYVGHSSNLIERIAYHKDGRVDATKPFRPVRLVYYSAFEDEALSIKFEKYLKTGSGFAFRNKHLICAKSQSRTDI
ncbi:GIY-YIG nuclease family protein [Candidatus Microgenomates bacterium]|nr:GIY-YIG nuclease family protein [Candidatus Microgenomates bacterium]